MSYSKEELSDIQSRITSEIESTQEIVEKFRELTKPIAPENSIGRVSRMDAINNKSVNSATLEKAITKLKNLQIALTKIKEVEFGLCRSCNQKIPIGRILLMPHTTHCVQCASRF